MTAGASALHDRVVLLSGVTGAVGSALAAELLAHGARLGIAVRRAWQVERVAATLRREQALVGVVASDDAEAAAGFVKGVEDSLGPIAAMISTAGAFTCGPVAASPADQLEQMLAANLVSVTTLARAVVPPMRRRRTGALVCTGALVAEDPPSGIASYVAAKAALHAWMRALARELTQDGIHVAVVAPATIDTEANRRAMPDADRSRWVPVARVVEALLGAATGPTNGPDPLIPLR
jgi:short-subunit dehydrogenase